jgi:imidazolonepropionase-like amidohydrolase
MLIRIAVVLLACGASGVAVVRQTAAPADLVVVNGTILTVDRTFTEARAFAVRDGRFVAVGSNDDARAHIGRSTRVIDARGRTVIPGIIDTHVHAAAGRAGARPRSVPRHGDHEHRGARRVGGGIPDL